MLWLHVLARGLARGWVKDVGCGVAPQVRQFRLATLPALDVGKAPEHQEQRIERNSRAVIDCFIRWPKHVEHQSEYCRPHKPRQIVVHPSKVERDARTKVRQHGRQLLLQREPRQRREEPPEVPHPIPHTAVQRRGRLDDANRLTHTQKVVQHNSSAVVEVIGQCLERGVILDRHGHQRVPQPKSGWRPDGDLVVIDVLRISLDSHDERQTAVLESGFGGRAAQLPRLSLSRRRIAGQCCFRRRGARRFSL
mmetsp:Transcript_51722/g.129908  ORF Transcript_51722/g.129908 Transcript_51722/m.129908 type:complete len:251 (-) Transcript_51722:225-977(-)